MSVFTKIISGEIPCYKITENDDFFVFLDINPNAVGHTLVVPKKEVDQLFDLDNELYLKLFQYAKTIAKALEKAVPCKRVGISVIGLEVPHVHVHLIPLNQMTDATFTKKESLSSTEFESLANKISSYL
ncbi:MAG: HIT family protein [Wenyingzhuangia sp.]|jgi:histidine triad (HIT) family protein|uniref:HIT family protein n=1 Tax=Wenyingzhuangia sp. TaxID=1964193 RepID=UPI00321942A8